MKAVIRSYEKTACRRRFRFFGNVELGRDIQVKDLRELYDQIVYAMGAETDRRLNIPGEDLLGSYGATDFVGWYNGHPDFLDYVFDLGWERAAVIGIGNVALDVTRILTRDLEELAKTDISNDALVTLRKSRVREVILLGRRGVAQAAFSPKEIKEVGDLSGVDLVVDPSQVELTDAERAELEAGSNALKNVEYLRKTSQRGEGGNPRKVRLRFLASPVELLGDQGRLTAMRVEKNRLIREENGWYRAVGTGEIEEIPIGMLFRSIGYRGVPVPGVPFDEKRGIIPNQDGRVVELETDSVRPREYVVGWAKRGPTGLIGTNRGCSARTASLMLEDLNVSTTAWPAGTSAEAVTNLLRERGVRFVTFEEWKIVDQIELDRGRSSGKVRDKILRLDEILAAIEEPRDETRRIAETRGGH
jgi:ferredoxin--NADP+ reductase